MALKPVDPWDNQRSEAAQCANTKRPLANQLDSTERQAALSMASGDDPREETVEQTVARLQALYEPWFTASADVWAHSIRQHLGRHA